jgi:tRNA dimethylallyltransferase
MPESTSVDIMMQHGLLTEAGHANIELNALQTVGYRELFSYLKEFSLQFAVEEIKNTSALRRQITWFKEIKPRMVRF